MEKSLEIENPSVTENAGIIQFYEMTFELGWKCLKDYFNEQGLDVKYPREVIKTGIEKEVLKDGKEWMQALNDRNLTSHLYDEQAAMQAVISIRSVYKPLFDELNLFFKKYSELSK